MDPPFDISLRTLLFWHGVKVFPFLAAVWLVCVGCGREQPSTERPPVKESPRPEDKRPLIVAFGDSLSAGYGLDAGQSYPDCLQRELDRRGLAYRVVNEGVSGDTTSLGLARLDSVIALRPAIVILELGANDGLRGIRVAASKDNLEKMILALRGAGARVVLAGMTLPPNYGPDYIRSFERMYAELAAKHKLPLIPFLLEGVAGTSSYMLRDGMHPNAEGAQRVAATVLKALEPLFRE
jgi:acyl-CoA thioesterase-1